MEFTETLATAALIWSGMIICLAGLCGIEAVAIGVMKVWEWLK